MCGIAGIISLRPEHQLDAPIWRMVDVQAHRGPDGRGAWVGSVGSAQVALGNVRLAILDLTDAGLQPMFSPSGDQVLVYNGELYNYRELRSELQSLGVTFRSQCDTEVVLQALLTWGEQAFLRMNGMWALAWADRRAGRILLSRDRFGIKPLYLNRAGDHLLFASEIKAILHASGRRFEVDTSVAGRFLEYSQLDAQDETFFAGIESLPAAHFISFDLTNDRAFGAEPRRYWAPPVDEVLNNGIAPSFSTIRDTFMDSVRLHLRSDVPVGILLSGGIDSSAVAAATRLALGPGAELNLISSVSDDPNYSEEPFIDRMTAHLGKNVRTTRVRFTAHDAMSLLDRVIWFNDEPVGGLSAVAHYSLMEQAKEAKVPVVLCGQGADELLCGYLKYWGFHLQSLVKSGRWVSAVRVASQVAMRGTVWPQVRINEAKRYLGALRPVGIDIRGPRLQQQDYSLDIGLGHAGILRRQLADLERYSLPALLHYEDRMSMAFSREIRVPFLDHRLVTQLLPLAAKWKMRDGWSKWVFRKALEPDMPPEITWRRDKRGFSTPENQWLKNELRPQIDAILREEMLIAEMGLIDQGALRRRYDAYCRTASDGGLVSFKDVFNPIALEIWARRFASYLNLRP